MSKPLHLCKFCLVVALSLCFVALSACGVQVVTSPDEEIPVDVVVDEILSGDEIETTSEVVISEDSDAEVNTSSAVDDVIDDIVVDDTVIDDIVSDPTFDPVVKAPTLEEGVSESMLVYDFWYSCLDWHMSISRDKFFSEFYVLRHEYAPDVLYTDWYVIQAGFTFPPTGSKIEEHCLSQQELDAFNEFVTELPDDRIVVDQQWTLYLLTWDHFAQLEECGITVHDVDSYTEGSPRPFLEDGSGWPTDWLRREPYATLLKEDGFDVFDPWWDEWNYKGVYEMVPYGEDTWRDFTAILTCIDVGRFHYDDGSSFTNQYLSWDDLRSICEMEGACVPDKYTPGVDSIYVP